MHSSENRGMSRGMRADAKLAFSFILRVIISSPGLLGGCMGQRQKPPSFFAFLTARKLRDLDWKVPGM